MQASEKAMRATLEIIAGPSKGQKVVLSGQEISIGREPSNSLALGERAISRRHCVIHQCGEGYAVRDLESRNGTFVNGVPATQRELGHGDEIRVGNSVIIYRLDPGEETGQSEVILGRSQLGARSTVFLRKEDALYLKPQENTGLPVTARVVRDLDALLRISREIHAEQGLSAVARRVVDCLQEVAPNSRAAVVLADCMSGELTPLFGRETATGKESQFTVDGGTIEQVLERGEAVLVTNAACSGADANGADLAARGLCAVMAVPLDVSGQTQGVLYLDTKESPADFDEKLLQLVTAIGSIAALPLETARRMEWLEGENQRLRAEINLRHDMVGNSAGILEVYQFVAKVAPKDSTVLIYGESGTGKELVARAVHRNSRRSEKPFIAINCAALPEALLESELFGHEKGAFTGAVAQKKGKLELAEGGTVFLDEIGELALPLQAKLLRALQEREIERVGGTRSIRLDVRLIAATNRNLREAAQQSTFRQDLYYRLNVVSVTMPPLRERREDIPMLAAHFIAKYSGQAGRQIQGISPEARACLMQYDWPGNIRELENAMERASVLGVSEWILPEDLPEALLEKAPGEVTGDGFHDAVRAAKIRIVREALQQCGGNFTEAAKLLGLHPNYLHRLVNNLDLRNLQASRPG